MTPTIVTVTDDLRAADAADGVVLADATVLVALRDRRGRRCETSGQPVVASAALADDGVFGSLQTVASDVLTAHAVQYRQAKSRLNRKLFRMCGVLLAAVALAFAATAFAFSEAMKPVNPLRPRLQAYRSNEPALEERLAARRMPKLRKELRAIREDEHYQELPTADQSFVTERLKEFDRYSEFALRFDPPTIPPNDIRTLAELDALEAMLADELAVPPAWAKTEAARLAAKWRDDCVLLRVAERRLTEWHRERAKHAVDLHVSAAPEPAWREDVKRVLAETPSLPSTGLVRGSVALPLKHGQALEAKCVHEHVRVENARDDAELVLRRLRCDVAMYDVLHQVGLMLRP